MDYESIKTAYEHYARLRDERLELDRQSAALKEQETEAKGHLLALLEGTEGMIVNGLSVRPVIKERPYITDYSALKQFILDTGNTQVFNRALNAKALSELGDVPGVGYFSQVDISTRKA